MITSTIAMQNAILAQNIAAARIMHSSDRMLSCVGYNNSQPLRPAFGLADYSEMQMKADETKISVMQKLAEAIQKKLGKDVKRSVPNYGGLDCIA